MNVGFADSKKDFNEAMQFRIAMQSTIHQSNHFMSDKESCVLAVKLVLVCGIGRSVDVGEQYDGRSVSVKIVMLSFSGTV